MELIDCESSKRVKLDDYKQVVIGRRRDTVRDKNVSRSQVILIRDGASYSIRNSGNNPVLVNGHRLGGGESTPLNADCSVRLPGNRKYRTSKRGEDMELGVDNLSVMESLRDEVDALRHLDVGWNEFDGGKLMVYSCYDRIGEQENCKVAAFDMDGTLIKTKSGKKFPVDENDWVFFSDRVVPKLRELSGDGYKIVVFSNQGGIAFGSSNKNKLKSKVSKIVSEIDIPMQVYFASSYDFYRKPCPGMFFAYRAINKYTVDHDKSFYCGDAAGRPAGWADGKKTDFSMADRLFSRNTRLRFLTPEELFLGRPPSVFNEPDFDPNRLPTKRHGDYDLGSATEVILMVGSPGSGKSHFVANHLLTNGYVSISRDVLNTWQNCVKAMEKYLALDKSVVIDNTNPTLSSREKYISVAKTYKAPVRCFIMDSPIDLCKHNNRFRQLTDKDHTLVTDVIIKDYWKKYQEPTHQEGLDQIVKVPFVQHFNNHVNYKLYKMYLY